MCVISGVTLVDARGADDREPAQHVPRGGAEGGHREAAHDARLRAREPTLLALEAELTVVLVEDAHGDVLGKPQEPVVKLAKVPEHVLILEFSYHLWSIQHAKADTKSHSEV